MTGKTEREIQAQSDATVASIRGGAPTPSTPAPPANESASPRALPPADRTNEVAQARS